MKNDNIFYLLEDPHNLPERKIASYSDTDEDNPFESIYCPEFKGHQRAIRSLTAQLRLIIPNNNDDLITTWYSDWLVNETVANLLKNNNITGYKLSDIIVRIDKRKGSNVNKKLYELVVTGSGGNIHPSSGYKVLDVCKYCGRVKFRSFDNGIIVDRESWDKSDIFTVREYPKYILVTERVRKIFLDNKITGCEFFHADKLKHNPLIKRY